MKQLTLILALSIAFASCKKQNNTPSQQSTQNSTTTPTTTPTSTTTANDTVGKIKVYYTVGLEYIITTSTATPVVPDFKQDTSGVRIFLNGTKLTSYDINSATYCGLTGLTTNGLYGGTLKAIWIKKSVNYHDGDSLTIQLDHVELRYGTGAGNNATARVTLQVWDAYGNTLTSDGMNPYINITNNSTTYGNLQIVVVLLVTILSIPMIVN